MRNPEVVPMIWDINCQLWVFRTAHPCSLVKKHVENQVPNGDLPAQVGTSTATAFMFRFKFEVKTGCATLSIRLNMDNQKRPLFAAGSKDWRSLNYIVYVCSTMHHSKRNVSGLRCWHLEQKMVLNNRGCSHAHTHTHPIDMTYTVFTYATTKTTL